MKNTEYVLYYCYAGCYSCSNKTFSTLKDRNKWLNAHLPVLNAWGIDIDTFSYRMENKNNPYKLTRLTECCEPWKIRYIIENFLKENNLEW